MMQPRSKVILLLLWCVVCALLERGQCQNTVQNTPSGTNNTSSTDAMNNATTTVATPIPKNESDFRGVPKNPTNVKAIAFDARAQVSWSAPTEDGDDPILGYEIVCFEEETNTAVEPSIIVGTMDGSSSSTNTSKVPLIAVVPNLKNGISYTFKVRARNKFGKSTWSAKSDPVSPLHPPDVCTQVSCSGNGACFPMYSLNATENTPSNVDNSQCICKPGYRSQDCSLKDKGLLNYWVVTPWSMCSNGCGGGQRTRTVQCMNYETSMAAPFATNCTEKIPQIVEICNGFECGSKLISVEYAIEMFFDDILFSNDAMEHFHVTFKREISAALQIVANRIEILSVTHGNGIQISFLILPPTKINEKPLNEVVNALQLQVNNKTSVLRTKGSFSRKVNPSGVKLSFFIAEQNSAGAEDDISIAGLIGTVIVLVVFISTFGWCLRRRYERLVETQQIELNDEVEMKANHSNGNNKGQVSTRMKKMGIRTMA